jgi:hypothetical protein
MLALAFVVATVLSACGVPTDASVRITDPTDVPFGLLSTVPPADASTTTTSAGRPMDTFGAYFVRNGQLSSIPAELEAPVDAPAALRVLLAGPNAEFVRAGLRTALVGDRLIRSTSVTAGTALVDLGDDFSALAPREQLLGLGQIVLTLTTLRGIGTVDVLVQGKRTEVRVGDGSLRRGLVARDDYVSLLEPS